MGNNNITDNSAYLDNQTVVFIDNMLNKNGKISNLLFGDFIKRVVIKLGTCVLNIVMLLELILTVIVSIIFGISSGFGIGSNIAYYSNNTFLGLMLGIITGIIITGLLIFTSLLLIICANYIFYLIINAHDNQASIARSLEIIANNKTTTLSSKNISTNKTNNTVLKCPKCQMPYSVGDKFCENCGEKLN